METTREDKPQQNITQPPAHSVIPLVIMWLATQNSTYQVISNKISWIFLCSVTQELVEV